MVCARWFEVEKTKRAKTKAPDDISSGASACRSVRKNYWPPLVYPATAVIGVPLLPLSAIMLFL